LFCEAKSDPFGEERIQPPFFA
jgi:hypothetical protein